MKWRLVSRSRAHSERERSEPSIIRAKQFDGNAGDYVHARDKEGLAALHVACRQEWEEVVQELIDRGSRVD